MAHADGRPQRWLLALRVAASEPSARPVDLMRQYDITKSVVENPRDRSRQDHRASGSNSSWSSPAPAGGAALERSASHSRRTFSHLPTMANVAKNNLMIETQEVFDIVVVGAGPAGLSFAASLRNAGMKIAIVERQDLTTLADPPYDGREIALTLKSVDLLKALGIWDKIPASAIAALHGARVLNGNSIEAMQLRPPPSASAQIGYLVPNSEIRRAAYENLRGHAGLSLITGCEVISVVASEDDTTIELAGGRKLIARLVVAADSRHSASRRSSGIPAQMTDFGKSMLVCRMSHSVAGDKTAWEWFGHHQTLALLPISEHCSSVVLTLPHSQVKRLMAMEPQTFCADMVSRFQGRLGDMSLASERYEYPLVAVYATRFVARRYAVIGDAAVGMHPVTAHGFNFGLLGQDTLARLLRGAHARGADVGAPGLLASYDRVHRRATLPLYLATNAIVRLYTDDSAPGRFARGALLGLARHVRPIGAALTALLMHRSRDTPARSGR